MRVCHTKVILALTSIIEPLIDLEMDQITSVFDTNVYSALKIVKAVVPSMAGRRSGLIINVGSVVGEMYDNSLLHHIVLCVDFDE